MSACIVPGSPVGFVDVPLRTSTLDRWLPRNRIVDALRLEIPSVRGVVLDVGCGAQPYRGLLTSAPSAATHYIGLDIASERHTGADVFWDGVRMPVSSASIDFVVVTEVLEHCPDPYVVVREVARVLRPGGRAFFTVPFLWPLHEAPYDEFRYTPFALERIFRSAELADVDIRPLGGWDASLAQLLGLWARRRPMTPAKRAVVSWALLPVVRWLAGKDELPRRWTDGAMVTGLSATATKPAAAGS